LRPPARPARTSPLCEYRQRMHSCTRKWLSPLSLRRPARPQVIGRLAGEPRLAPAVCVDDVGIGAAVAGGGVRDANPVARPGVLDVRFHDAAILIMSASG